MKIQWLVTLLALSSCATSPLGRKQVLLLGDSQMDTMGVQSFEELKSKTPIEHDARTNAYVRCIADAVIGAATGRTSNRTWEIVVFRDPTANAFALPGGKIGVHTGILPVAKTPAQLAAVLGHEVGHVIARHGNERVSQGEIASILLSGVDLALQKMESSEKNALLAGLGLGAQVGVLLPFSRAQESEADLIGLELMARAGFDPDQSVELWKNMSAASKGAPPEWLSTHPSSSSRIAALESHAPSWKGTYIEMVRSGRNPSCVLK